LAPHDPPESNALAKNWAQIRFVEIDSRARSTASTPFEEAAMCAVVESYYAVCGKRICQTSTSILSCLA